MRESCMYGSVRGARGNSRPYRDRRAFITLLCGVSGTLGKDDDCSQAGIDKAADQLK